MDTYSKKKGNACGVSVGMKIKRKYGKSSVRWRDWAKKCGFI